MSSKAEKERAKALQEKFQAILSNLLKDDDNKYCVDCDAKGPRWASWNLGIFLCIRCAGIHRNLGVHISRVKSVNLDSWTPEQVAMMQEVGNSRARAAYEANIPDNFRRPQTDSALEAFIRAKYETKKYIAREWITPKPTVPKEWLEDERDKKRSKPKPASTVQLNTVPKAKPSPSNSSQEKKSSPDQVKAPPTKSSPAAQQPQQSSGAADLIGLDASSPTSQQPNGGGNLLDDIFGNSAPVASQSAQTPTGGAGVGSPQGGQQNGSIEASLFDDGSSDKGSEKSTKESILALYGGGPQQQMFGVPATSAPSASNDDLLKFTSSQDGLLPTPAQPPMHTVPQQSTNLMSNSQFSTNLTSNSQIPTNLMSNNQISANLMSNSQVSANQPTQLPNQYLQAQPQMCYVPSGFCYDAGGVYMPQQNMGMYAGAVPAQMPNQQAMAGGMQYQQGMMGMQQPNMYNMGQMGGAMQGGMMGGQPVGGNMMMGGQQQMYPQQQQMQQMQFQQMQQQMGAMKLAGAGQMGGMAPGGAPGWSQQNSGQTLSTNLWQ